MQIVIHRGSHQIGGIATEIRTSKTRILIDMGDELHEDGDGKGTLLSIPGVTDFNGTCDAVLFTHNHGDHIGQLNLIREDIPLYMGSFAKEVFLMTKEKESISFIERIKGVNTFEAGIPWKVGDIYITPFSVDHSACDSYMFLIEADGKRVLYTGDFRMHGLRGKGIPKILWKLVRKVDVLITEGTSLSRSNVPVLTERELQEKAREYMRRYKYVFVLCASTNLERICALSKAVPNGKYFICDKYQKRLLDLIEKQWSHHSSLYRNIKRTSYGENLDSGMKDRGFLMMVRDNVEFRRIMRKFDPEQSIILYSMWDGYRTRPGSTIPSFLDIISRWEPFHTSGHVSVEDLQEVIEIVDPGIIIPIHTDKPEALKEICSERTVVLLNDGIVYDVS